MDLRRLRHRIIQNEIHEGRRKTLARRFFNARLRGGAHSKHDAAMKVLEMYNPFANGHPGSTRTREETYGELEDVAGLLRHLPRATDARSVFVDVGSGYGRLAMYVALATPCARVVGLEIHKDRHDLAAKMQREQAALVPHLEFTCADVRTTGIPSDATHIFMCSTCFSAELCRAVVDKAPASAVCLVSLTPLDTDAWTLQATHSLKCTWSTSKAHYYVRKAA